MSNTTEEQKYKLPVDLPKCDCFSDDEPAYAMGRCAEVAKVCSVMSTAFVEMASSINLCKEALPYLAEIMMVSVLTTIARVQGPALEFGSREIEWEVERLLLGLEARVLARVNDVYKRSRDAGMTEATFKAFMERQEQEGGLS